MTIHSAYQQLQGELQGIYGPGEARSIARIVFEDALGQYALSSQAVLPQEQWAELQGIQARLLQQEPVQYVLGQADFYGLKLKVDKRVLIPRQETEELVHWVLEREARAGLRLLDIGTGSGCIALALKQQRPDWAVQGIDRSPGALALAAENAQSLDLEVDWALFDILEAEHWPALGPFDVVVSNPPYIPPSEQSLMPPHVLRHEPELALFTATEDALVFYRAIGQFAQQRLLPGGRLYFELNEFHAQPVADSIASQGFGQIELQQDISGKPRMLRAVLTSSVL